MYRFALVLRKGRQEHELAVTVHHPAATVGELARALGAGDGLVIGGCRAAAELRLADAGVHQGVVVGVPSRRPRPTPVPASAPALTLDATAGLVAGTSWPLPIGITTVGRHPGNDVVVDHPTVSARHCSITVDAGLEATVSDLGSHNGTWLGGEGVVATRAVAPGSTVRIGAVHLVLRAAADGEVLDLARPDHVGPAGTVPFNRPPRPAPPPGLAALPVPGAPAPPHSPTPLSIVALVAPLAFAGVMVAVLGRLVYGLFAVLGPVMALGTWVEGRRRNRRTARRDGRELAHEVDRFRGVLAEGAGAEAAHRAATVPDPAVVLRRALGPSPRLWERRPTHDDFLRLHAGTGDLPWSPLLADDGRTRPPAVAAVLASGAVLADVPVVADLGGGGVVGIVGDRPAALALARSLLCQAATHSGPADVAVAVVTDPGRVGDWDWSKWLPHTRSPADPDTRLLAGDPTAGEGLLRALLGAGTSGPTVSLVVVDTEGLNGARGAAARAVLRGEGGPVAGIVVAAAEHHLPAMCTTVVELSGLDGQARLQVPHRAHTVDRFLAAGVTERVARRWARSLARFDDPEAAGHAPVLPHRVSLVSLFDVDPFDPAAVAAGWRPGARRFPPGVPVGVTEEGPLRIDLFGDQPHVSVTGGTGSGRGEVLHSLVAGLAVLVDPQRLHLALLSSADGPSDALCARLPHTVGVVTATDGGSGQRAVRAVEDEVRRRQARPPSAEAVDVPRLVVVVDDVTALTAAAPGVAAVLEVIARRGRELGVHLLVAGEEAAALPEATFPITLAGDRPGRGVAGTGGSDVAFVAATVTGTTGPGSTVEVRPFRFGPAPDVEPTGPADDHEPDLARLVGAVAGAFQATGWPPPPRLWAAAVRAHAPRPALLAELLGAGDWDDVEPAVAWQPRSARDVLRVPIGVTPAGDPLHLDLKEAAQGGMGPHGLVVGATGSGKSELLRTLVTGLAVTHPPDRLAFVLVDFKGGATFAGLAGLPHVAGMITNLEDDPALVDRMHAALLGEQRRRQELLRAAGDLSSRDEYELHRAAGADLEPLPSLVIVVDEFAELLTSRPDFIEVFVAVGRLGRSLGMHLVLASQRLDEGRLRGLESHLSYRVGLRTFTAADSRAVLHVPDAYQLPPEPGGAYLKVDNTVFERFRAALVASAGPGGDRTGLPEVAVDRLRRAAAPTHQVWLPPLPAVVTLDQLLPGLGEEDGRGLVAAAWPGVGRLAVPVGVLDKPDEQAQFLLVADLGGAEGNLAVVGAPQTGKSTLVRTVLSAFFLTHTPAEVQFYCVDYGGGGLQALRDAPHVGGVAGRLDAEGVSRVVREVEAVLERRERLFRAHGIDGAATFRHRLSAGDLPDERHGDVFLVIDDWPALRQRADDVEDRVVDIAGRGLGYGVHVVVTANRWTDIRSNLRDTMGSRLELRLNDPTESDVDRRTAANVPPRVPGRGLTRDGLHFQAALPGLDGRTSACDLPAALVELVDRVRTAWTGPPAPPVRVLPTDVSLGDLPVPGAEREPGVPVGIAEYDLQPAYVDLLGADPHFVVYGDGESGKTTFLRTYLAGLTTRCCPEQATVLVVDYRRTLLGAVPEPHLAGYAVAAAAAAAHVARIHDVLAARLPCADGPADQLGDRTRWSGPEVFVVVDDYDLVVTPSANPVAALLDLLAHGRDVGLHLILARRVAGASRAAFEPVLQRVRDLGSPGLLLSGDGREGPLVEAQRARGQPPGRGLLVRRRREPGLVQVARVVDQASQ